MVKRDLAPEMDRRIKRMLELMEEDGDSFAKKAEMYYKKRPELISHVEEFYGMYRSLVERYDHLKGDLRRNSSSTDLQSMGSGISDICFEQLPPTCPNPERKLSRRMSDGGSVQLPTLPTPNPDKKLGRRISDIGSEQLSTLSTPEQKLGRKISGHRAAGFDVFLGSSGGSNDVHQKEADESYTSDSDPESDDLCYPDFCANSGNNRLHYKIIELEIELRETREKLRSQQQKKSKEKIWSTSEKIRLLDDVLDKLKAELEVHNASAAQMGNSYLKEEVIDTNSKASSLNDKEELRITKERLAESERKVNSLRIENDAASERILQLQDQLASAQNEIAVLKLDREGLNARIATLNGELCSRDNKLDEQDKHLNKLRKQRTELISWVETAHKQVKRLRSKADELEEENERQRVLMSEGAEEKREAIRQLCFSLEHYRIGYNRLRQAYTEHREVALLGF